MRPPVARVDPVRDTYFGVTVDDPYRWMEQPSAEFEAWLDGQGAYARTVLDAVPDRSALYDRIRALRGDGVSRHGFAFAGDRVFRLRDDPGAGVPVLVVDEGGNEERVLLDPNAIAGDRHSNLAWYVPSPDGRYVACAIAEGGSEESTLRVLDTRTGALLGEAITGTWFPFLSWLADGASFLYHRHLDLAPGAPVVSRRMNSRSLVHRLGDGPASDTVVLARGVNPRIPLTALDRPFLYHVPGTAHVLAVISHTAIRGYLTDEQLTDCTLYLAPLTALLADPAGCPWTRIAEAADGVSAFAFSPDTIYLVSRREAPCRRVLAAPLADPEAVRVFVPETDRVVEAVRVVGDRLLIRELDGGIARLRHVPLAGGTPEEVPLPFDGQLLEWTGAPDRPEALLRLESWTVAPRVYRYEAGTVTGTDWAVTTPEGFADIEAYRVSAPARDGTPVPITMVHRKGLPRNGDNPTLLEAYGSYGVVMDPLFWPGVLAWLERGGMWAVAHVRGGGEYGPAWHEAGRLRHKERTITDFVDCAEYLVAQGYTRPALIAGMGVSAGGIPTGGALVRRPDLWGAMVMHVPFANALRGEFSGSGPLHVPEFGSVTTEEGLDSLLQADPYHLVRDGAPYPAVLLTTGRNDHRVPPWQPGKMAARLQAATSSGKPILLAVDDDAGHGFGSTADQRDRELADVLAFLFTHLR
jgi:prolyl oligopeptidase